MEQDRSRRLLTLPNSGHHNQSINSGSDVVEGLTPKAFFSFNQHGTLHIEGEDCEHLHRMSSNTRFEFAHLLESYRAAKKDYRVKQKEMVEFCERNQIKRGEKLLRSTLRNVTIDENSLGEDHFQNMELKRPMRPSWSMLNIGEQDKIQKELHSLTHVNRNSINVELIEQENQIIQVQSFNTQQDTCFQEKTQTALNYSQIQQEQDTHFLYQLKVSLIDLSSQAKIEFLKRHLTIQIKKSTKLLQQLQFKDKENIKLKEEISQLQDKFAFGKVNLFKNQKTQTDPIFQNISVQIRENKSRSKPRVNTSTSSLHPNKLLKQKVSQTKLTHSKSRNQLQGLTQDSSYPKKNRIAQTINIDLNNELSASQNIDSKSKFLLNTTSFLQAPGTKDQKLSSSRDKLSRNMKITVSSSSSQQQNYHSYRPGPSECSKLDKEDPSNKSNMILIETRSSLDGGDYKIKEKSKLSSSINHSPGSQGNLFGLEFAMKKDGEPKKGRTPGKVGANGGKRWFQRYPLDQISRLGDGRLPESKSKQGRNMPSLKASVSLNYKLNQALQNSKKYPNMILSPRKSIHSLRTHKP